MFQYAWLYILTYFKHAGREIFQLSRMFTAKFVSFSLSLFLEGCLYFPKNCGFRHHIWITKLLVKWIYCYWWKTKLQWFLISINIICRRNNNNNKNGRRRKQTKTAHYRTMNLIWMNYVRTSHIYRVHQ